MHINYEDIEPFSLIEETDKSHLEASDYRVTKMRFAKSGKSEDNTKIIFNDHLSLVGIPEIAYQYVVNGRSAIGWIMKRYQIETDDSSGITNDPNTYATNSRYIVELIKRVVTVSLGTVQIVEGSPSIDSDWNA